jgi:hypothetical protein
MLRVNHETNKLYNIEPETGLKVVVRLGNKYANMRGIITSINDDSTISVMMDFHVNYTLNKPTIFSEKELIIL